MRTRSSPLPFLPLEVKHDILRFCDPSTLAKTAQVSLAFLQLSSPILYEDVHIDGIEALKILFSERESPPSLSIAPFLSLSQIRYLTVHISHQHLPPSSDALDDLSLDRTPSSSLIPIQQLKIVNWHEQGSSDTTMISHSPFVHLLNPLHLYLRAPPLRPFHYFEVESFLWPRLESLHLESISADLPLFESWPSSSRPHLALLTYHFEQVYVGGDLYHDLVDCMPDDLPMSEGVEVVAIVGDETRRLETASTRGGSRQVRADRDRVLSELKVVVEQRPYPEEYLSTYLHSDS